jgi:hypothetical protein
MRQISRRRTCAISRLRADGSIAVMPADDVAVSEFRDLPSATGPDDQDLRCMRAPWLAIRA